MPFACGVALGRFLPESLLPDPGKRLLTSLFLGIALSISSIKIVAAIVREMNFTRRNLGQVIVASAIMEDTLGWIIIAITFGLAEAGTIDLASVAMSVLGTAIFLVASFTIGRPIVFYLIRWANDNFKSDFPVITTILVIMGVMALTTHFIGVHTVLGAFIAGVLIGESPILTKHIDEQLRGLIVAFFMPVFFGTAGLSADLTILRDPQLLLLALGLIAIASIGKFAGAFIGGKIGGLTRPEALALACGMNARGSTEVIVATIGLSMGALTQDLFTMIVTMAFVTTMGMPPMLRWSLSRVPLGKAERERLEREEFEAKGFVAEPGALAAGRRRQPQRQVHLSFRRPDREPRRPADHRPAQAQGLPKPAQARRRGEIQGRAKPDTEADKVAEQALEAAAADVKKTRAQGRRAGRRPCHGPQGVGEPDRGSHHQRSQEGLRPFVHRAREHQIKKRRVQSRNRRHGDRFRGTAGDRDGTGPTSRAAGSMRASTFWCRWPGPTSRAGPRRSRSRSPAPANAR